MNRPWYENAVFYGIDVRRFQDSNGDGFGDFQGLISRLDYLHDLGINALWLMPFFDTPLKDNGYDVCDYYQVDPRVGNINDFLELVEQAHKRDIYLVMDLVMNHTSDQHPWFLAASRAPSSRFHDYYIWTNTIPEESLGGGTIFPGEEDSVWTYDPVAKAYFFHRFYHFQPGLRMKNPKVQDEVHKAVDYWLSLKVDGFRFDAAPVMIQPKGLESTRLVHPNRFFKEIHHEAVQRNPNVVLLGEANVPLNQMDEFFGGGSDLNMLLNFLIGPHIMLSMAERNASSVRTYLKGLLVPPKNDQWLNFLRNLDELSLERLPKEQQNIIFETFAPEENMRIYGRGIRRRLAPMIAEQGQDMYRQRLELVYSLLFSTPGAQMFVYGDEIGMGDDLSLPGRNAVRTPMQWNAEKNAGFSNADDLVAPVINRGLFRYSEVNVKKQEETEGSFLRWIKQLIAARNDLPEIGYIPTHIMDTEEGNIGTMAHLFTFPDGDTESVAIILFHNFQSQNCKVSVSIRELKTKMDQPDVVFGKGEILHFDQERLSVEMPAYGYLWVRI